MTVGDPAQSVLGSHPTEQLPLLPGQCVFTGTVKLGSLIFCKGHFVRVRVQRIGALSFIVHRGEITSERFIQHERHNEGEL